MAEKSFDYQTLLRLIGLARPYRTVFIIAAILAVIMAPLAALRPYLINVMVDSYILNFDLQGLIDMTLLLFGILLAEAVMQYGFVYSTNLLGQSVIKDLRVRLFNHLTSLKLRFFDRTPIGTVTTRTINDIESINTVFSQGGISILADLLTIFAVIGIMFFTSWRLTLICLIAMPIMLLATYIFKEKVKVAYQKVRNEIARMNSFLQERISGMTIVQVFNAEEREMNKFKAINRKYTQANLDSILYYAIFFPFVDIVSAAALGLMVWWGARGVISEEITFGALVAFPIYLSMLFRPLRQLADRFNTLQMGMVAAERVFRLLDSREQISDSGDKIIETFQGKLEFQDVSFAYDNINFVIKDFNLIVEPGETLAIVGSTGSGKTTIINILNRFYELDKGRILVDGVDIREMDLASFRSRISIVLQDVFLFSGSVLDNIRMRDRKIPEELVHEAAELIGADEFIEKLPGGYDFVVSERGGNLSMGQRQLVSFVRALIFDPDVLILDEATSSIDTETEATIQYAIEKLIEKRTSLIIAHRLSTIRHANKILVMDQGRIKEYGTHEELMQIKGGKYRDLYEMQFLEMEVSR